MVERAEMLAERFLKVNSDVVVIVEQCLDEAWQAMCDGEDRPLSVLVHHIAGAYAAEVALMTAALKQQPVTAPYQNRSALDQWNAEYAEQHRGCNKTETVAVLRHNGAAAARFIRELSDEELRTIVTFPLLVSWYGRPPTVEQLVEGLLIGHPSLHLPAIRAVIDK